MAAILASFFVGLTVLAHLMHVQPAAQVTVISQVAKTAFGDTPPYYLLQAATMLILIMASNTSFADFPRLASIMARDGFLPRHMMFRGDRLAFSAGILVLGVLASVLLVLFKADTHRLIPLYAVGVFLSFTLSQSGMVVHWLRSQEAGRRRSMIINGDWRGRHRASSSSSPPAPSSRTAPGSSCWRFRSSWRCACRSAATTDASAGNWRYARAISTSCRATPPGGSSQTVIVPVEGLDRAVLRTIEYARSLSQNVTAVHITDDVQEAEALRAEWEEKIPDVPIVIVESPYRALVAPFLAYVDAVDRANPRGRITVVLPEFVPAHFWQSLLHNQPATRPSRPDTASWPLMRIGLGSPRRCPVASAGLLSSVLTLARTDQCLDPPSRRPAGFAYVAAARRLLSRVAGKRESKPTAQNPSFA